MLQLPAGQAAAPAWFPDHSDRWVGYALPADLVVGREPDGDPRFALVRYRGGDATGATGGAYLHLELGLGELPETAVTAATAAGITLAPAAFLRSRFRLVRWLTGVPTGDPVGPWQETTPGGEILVGAVIQLTADEATILAEALDGDTGAAVIVEAIYRGLVAGLPAVAVVDRSALRRHLDATLSAGPVTMSEIAAAFLSLPSGDAVVEIRPTDGTAAPPRDAALSALAQWAVLELFAAETTDPWAPARFVLRDVPDSGAVWICDLSPWRAEDRTWSSAWSVTGLLHSLTPDQRARAYPSLPVLSPFARVQVLVTCSVPIDAEAVRAVDVVLRSTGPGGVPEFHPLRFDGTRSTVYVNSFRPTAADPELAVRVTTTLGPAPIGPPWPRVLSMPFRDVAGTYLDVTAADTGAQVVQVGADTGVFSRVGAVDVTLYRGGEPLARRTLTTDRPWCVLAAPAGPPPGSVDPADAATTLVVAEAVEPAPPDTGHEARRAVVLERVLTADAGDRLTVPAHAVEVLSPDDVVVTLDPAAAAHAAYVAVVLADGTGRTRTSTLAHGVEVTWPCWRPTVFDQPTYRYQVLYVPRDPDGGTRPLVTGPWIDAASPRLLVTLPPEIDPDET